MRKIVAGKHLIAGGLILLYFGIFFVSAEILLRIVEYCQYTKLSNRFQFEEYKKIYSDERDKDYMYDHRPNVKIRLEKGYYNFTFITNSDGLREEKDYDYLEKSIIFLGDSIVEGSSVENDETMSKVFENETGITTLNFGLGSASTVNEYYWLKNKYKKSYNTKLIILGFCLNDFEQNTYRRCFDMAKGNWQLYRYLDSAPGTTTAVLYNRLKNILKRSRAITYFYNIPARYIFRSNNTLPNNTLPMGYEYVSQRSKIYTELYIVKIKDFAQSIGSEFAVVIFPNVFQLTISYGTHKKAQDVLTEILRKNNIRYIDLYDMVRDNHLAHPEVHWYHDDVHPYKEGHKLIGKYLAVELPKVFPNIFQKK